MRLRLQRHSFSCGLACVATIANKPYATVLRDYRRLFRKDAKKVLYNGRWIIDYSTETRHIYHLLKHYGIRAGKTMRTYRGKDYLPELSILETKLHKEKFGLKIEDCWHWVVAKKEGNRVKIFDPNVGMRTLREVGPISAYLRVYG